MAIGRRAKVKANIPSKTPTREQLQKESQIADAEQNDDEEDFRGFGIEWNADRTHFTSRQYSSGEAYKFYGWFRRTRAGSEDAYAIDIYAKHKTADYAADSIIYHDNDPRKKLVSLNADIAAAINKWFYTKLDGSFKTINILKLQAEQPTIHITKIGSIDAIILKLKECRDVAIRCGGHRLVQLVGDNEKDIPLNITINVTSQALSLKGKVPTLEMGSLSDAVLVAGGNSIPLSGAGRPQRLHNTPDPSSIKALAERLRVATPAEQRKIRAAMRRMGHKGGARALTSNRPKGNEPAKKGA